MWRRVGGCFRSSHDSIRVTCRLMFNHHLLNAYTFRIPLGKAISERIKLLEIP